GVGVLGRRDQQRPNPVPLDDDRLQAVPGPRLHTLAERVVHGDRDIHLGGFVLGHPLFEGHVVRTHDREVLGGYPVTLGAVAVAPKGDSRLTFRVRRQDDPPTDVLRQRLLEYAPVDDLYCKEPTHGGTSALTPSSSG